MKETTCTEATYYIDSCIFQQLASDDVLKSYCYTNVPIMPPADSKKS